MANQPNSARQTGFCTFCMDSFPPERIGAHVRRCSARRDDADCIPWHGQPHPLAFLLMVEIENWPEAWLCVEAYCEARFADLDRFLHYIWFADSSEPGIFFPQGRLRRRIEGKADLEDFRRLGGVLEVKDCFSYVLSEAGSTIVINLEVVGRLPTAIGDRSIDLAAFPNGSDGGLKPGGLCAKLEAVQARV